MRWVPWVLLLLLGLTVGGWMTFDALRRLILGDYVRVDGQLGPWQHLFQSVGVRPTGGPVAVLYLLCGVARLAATVGLLGRTQWGWEATLLSAIAALWFLPIGTATSVITLVLLFTAPLRSP